VGYFALLRNTTGGTNTAVGAASLDANTTGEANTALGYEALGANTTANANTGIGNNALGANTTGAANSAVGSGALAANTTAASNTAVGYNSLNANTTGDRNTTMGTQSGDGITTGVSNVIIGFDAGSYTNVLTTGSQNVLVGAYNNTNAADSTYAMGLGYNLTCTSGYTTLGNNVDDIRAAHGVATWATVSDERYKKDITDSTTGLSFINALQPRTFKYKTLGELPETFNAYEADSTEVFKNSNTNHGFIAQEVKAAIDADDSIKDGFRLWDDREDGSQEVAEAALIPVLVKAIQELSAQNAELTTRITALEG
jgi:trimeric autotransporter adhesin